MQSGRTLLVLGFFCAWVVTGFADPAVLLKEYPAQIMRGKYVLGTRVVKMGEVVTVQAVKGISAEVTTDHNDKLTVLLADLRALPEPTPPPPAPRLSAVPSPVPDSTPASTPASVPASTPEAVTALLPPPPPIMPVDLPIARTEVKNPDDAPKAERREVKVRCTHLTKKGKQCTRMTASPNGFCWQHGGD